MKKSQIGDVLWVLTAPPTPKNLPKDARYLDSSTFKSFLEGCRTCTPAFYFQSKAGAEQELCIYNVTLTPQKKAAVTATFALLGNEVTRPRTGSGPPPPVAKTPMVASTADPLKKTIHPVVDFAKLLAAVSYDVVALRLPNPPPPAEVKRPTLYPEEARAIVAAMKSGTQVTFGGHTGHVYEILGKEWNNDLDYPGFLFVETTAGKRIIYVAMHGTRNKSGWITNYRNGADPHKFGAFTVTVHEGFAKRADHMKAYLFDLFDTLKVNAHDEIIFTGHSGGGVNAVMAAMFTVTEYMAARAKIATPNPQSNIVKVYGISSPDFCKESDPNCLCTISSQIGDANMLFAYSPSDIVPQLASKSKAQAAKAVVPKLAQAAFGVETIFNIALIPGYHYISDPAETNAAADMLGNKMKKTLYNKAFAIGHYGIAYEPGNDTPGFHPSLVEALGGRTLSLHEPRLGQFGLQTLAPQMCH